MNARLTFRRILKASLFTAIVLIISAIYILKSPLSASIQKHALINVAATYASGAFVVLLLITAAYIIFSLRKK